LFLNPEEKERPEAPEAGSPSPRAAEDFAEAEKADSAAERILYVDEEEPGLIILRPASHDPLASEPGAAEDPEAENAASRALTPSEPPAPSAPPRPSPPSAPPLPPPPPPLEEERVFPLEFREYIVLADPAPSGRRSLARRLEGLPFKLVEAANAKEVVKACAAQDVGLIIFDSDMPESEVREALQRVNSAGPGGAAGRPPVPALGLILHASQNERLLRLGCVECQINSVSRSQFQQTVLRLCPCPESSLAEEGALSRPKAASAAPYSGAGKKKWRVPLLDLIISSLDENAPDKEQEEGSPASGKEAGLCRVAGTQNDYLRADMLPHIPDFLIVLEDTLEDLDKARREMDLEAVHRLASRMIEQAAAYGLEALENMARCAEKAAQAQDQEAVGYIAEDLSTLGRRYLVNLNLTYARRGKQ
jgi:CheY-like chemotaxis protein